MEPRQRYVVIGAHLTPQANPERYREMEDILNGYSAKGYRVVQEFSGSFLLLEWIESLDTEQATARAMDAAVKTARAIRTGNLLGDDPTAAEIIVALRDVLRESSEYLAYQLNQALMGNL